MNSQRHHLAATIAERTLHVSDTDELAREVAAYLLHENKVAELDSLMRDVIAYRAEHGVVEAVALSAHDLDHTDLEDIEQLLQEEYPSAKQFTVDQVKVPELIGGVKIELPGEQLDLTVRAKVNTFKRLTTGKDA